MIIIDWLQVISPQNGNSKILGYHAVWKLLTAGEWEDLIYPDVPYTDSQARAT